MSQEARIEPGQNLLIDDDLSKYDLPPIKEESADTTGHTPGWCNEQCGRHIIHFDDYRLQELPPGLFKEILKDLWNRGALDRDNSGPFNIEILKVIRWSTTWVTCDGRLLPGYVYIYRSGLAREQCTPERYGSDVLLRLLFKYNRMVREKVRTTGKTADLFGGELVREGYEEALNISTSRLWTMLNDGVSITIVPASG